MSNRAAKYELLFKSLKKHFKPQPEMGERTVLEHLIYACCLEDAKAEHADEAFAKLQQAYFDWNEVRVTTVIELGEALSSLPNPTAAGHRIKRCLQSLFEARYQYDIDDLKKANLGKATEELTNWKGVTPFILGYVSQNALGGHFIPVDTLTLDCMQQADIITESEAEKKSLPGVERAVPKTKGYEFASLLHQFAVEFHHSPKSAAVLAVFKDLGVTPKPKPVEKPAPAKPKPIAKESVESHDEPATSKGKPTVTADAASKKTDKTKPPTTAKVEPPPVSPVVKPVSKVEPKQDPKKAVAKPEPKKTVVAKPEPKKPESKPVTKKPAEKTAEKPAEKPAAKKSDVKPAPKKAADSKKPEAKKSTASSDSKPKSKNAPTKAGAPKAASKGGSKEATNVKMTKKKPR
jgi:endonuclease III